MPTALLAGGLLAGIVWRSWPGSSTASAPAGAPAGPAVRSTSASAAVADELVLAPLEAELATIGRLHAALDVARGGRRRAR